MSKRSKVAFEAAVTNFSDAWEQKIIAGDTIVSRMVSVLRLGKPVKADQLLSDIVGGEAGVWDLTLQLMRYPPFFRDGLNLTKKQVEGIETVGELGDLVFAWYAKNGWTIR